MAAKRAIFTIVTKSYLAYARAMAKELHIHNPKMPFYVFLADHPDNLFELDKEPFHIVQIEQILPAGLLQTMTGYYTAYEFCNALKPFASLYMSKLTGISQWFYLDSDIYISGNFELLFSRLNDASLLLTPHILQVDAVPQVENLELIFLRTGIYNAGCIGISNCDQALQFLKWWKERLIWHCLHNSPSLEADQSWLNFAPSLFPDCKIVRDPCVNVAYWNIHERLLEENVNGGFSVKGCSVPFIHFSGWDWRNPDVPTRHYNVELGLSKDAWLVAARDFARLLQACGVENSAQWPYSFAKAKNGCVLTPSMRRNFRSYLRNKDKNAPIVSIFDKPEMYEEPKPKAITLWAATRTWLGKVKRRLS